MARSPAYGIIIIIEEKQENKGASAQEVAGRSGPPSVPLSALCANLPKERLRDHRGSACDVLGSIYQLMGTDPEGKLANPMDLPLTVTPTAADGVPVAGRLKEIM